MRYQHTYLLILLVGLLFSCQKPEEHFVPEMAGEGPSALRFNVLLDGDSRTDGWNCKEKKPYLEYLELGDLVNVKKVSYGGATSWQLAHRAADVYSQKKDPDRINVVVLWVGVNDLVVHNQNASKVFQNIRLYCEERKKEGWDVILCTEVSMKGEYGEWVFDRERLILNDSIRSNWVDLADGLADLERLEGIGGLNGWSNEEYFCDGIHLTNHGSVIAAKEIEETIRWYRMNQIRKHRQRGTAGLIE